MHRSMAVVVWLQAMSLVSLYTRADALGHAFCVCVFAGLYTIVWQ